MYLSFSAVGKVRGTGPKIVTKPKELCGYPVRFDWGSSIEKI